MPDELTMRRRGDGARLGGSRRRSAVSRRLRPERETLEDRLAPAVAGWSGVGAAAAVHALVSGVSNSTTTAESSSASVPTAARYAVSESLGKTDPAYAVTASGDGYAASNATNQYTATVDAGGLRVSTGSDAWSLTVSGIGYGDSLQALGSATATATANRVEYDYGGVSQWFVNGPLGLQQGFTLDQRPSGGGAGAPLTVGLALGGDLIATADPGGTSVSLARADGGSALSYGGLIAYDATGKAVPAHLSVTTTADGQSLSIQVDDAGAQYPLTIDPFIQQSKLTGAAVDLSFFGYSVGMNSAGTVMIVGAKGQQSAPNNGRGAAYIFTRTETTWAQTAVLTASDAADGDEFGTSVAISLDGATAVVGAPNATVDGHALQGAVYVFSPSGGVWAQAKKVTADDGAAGDHFGTSVSIAAAGGAFVVGAPDAKVGANAGQGASYVYTGAAAAWTQAARLVASDGVAGDGFGSSVSISGDGGTAAIGAPDATGHKGAVYLFTGAAGPWTQATRLDASDAVAGSQLGWAVSTSYDGGVVLAGAPGAASTPGAAYLYTKSISSWSQTTKLAANDASADDGFGFSVAISADGGVAVVGSPQKASGASQFQGAAYVYTRSGGGWPQTAKLVSNDGAAFDLFGSSVALSTGGGFVLAGAPRAAILSHLIQGAAYVYSYSAPVVVTTNPVDQTTTVGSPVTFTAAATGSPGAVASWQVSTDGGVTFNNMTGEVRNWLTVTPTLANSNNLYRAYFFNAAGSSAPTTVARLTVLPRTSLLSVTSDSNPRPVGGTLNFTVVVTAADRVGTPNGGQVNLYFGATLYQSAPLVNGKAVFNSIPTQAVGTYQVGATYSGDSTFNWSQGTMTQVVSQGTSSLSLNLPAQVVAGQPVLLGGVLSYQGTTQPPTGNVMYLDDGWPINFLPVVTSGGATWTLYSISTLSVGTHHIQLVYFGDAQTASSSSPVATLVVTAAGAAASAASPAPVTAAAAPPSTTAPAAAAPSAGGAVSSSTAAPAAQAMAATSSVTVTTNPVSRTTVLGNTVTFTASASGADPIGVQWQASGDGGATFVDVPGANQTSLVLTPSLAYSGVQYRAVFTDFLGSYTPTTAATLTVVRRASALTITSSSNPRPIGGDLSFTVAVASANGIGAPNGGVVNIYFGSTLYQSAPLVNGKAVFNSIPSQALGSYQVGATYSGDANFDWSQNTLAQVVTKAPSYLWGVAPTQVVAGQAALLGAVLTYTGAAQPPTGNVVIMDNGLPIRYLPLTTSGGSTWVLYSNSALSVGTHYIQMLYFGDSQTLASSSAVTTLVVSPAAARATAAAPTPASAGVSALGVLPTTRSTTAAITTTPAPRAAAVQPTISAAAPRASAARVLQQRFSVAYKMS